MLVLPGDLNGMQVSKISEDRPATAILKKKPCPVRANIALAAGRNNKIKEMVLALLYIFKRVVIVNSICHLIHIFHSDSIHFLCFSL